MPHGLKAIVKVSLFSFALALAPSAAPAAADTGGAKTAITVWWVVFNHPEECTDGCGSDDTSNPAVGASVFFATGALVDADGRAQLVTSLYKSGDDFSDIGPYTSLIGGPGLVNAQGAEFHVVVRSHGPAAAGLESEQITTFLEPNCQALGGPNACQNIQVALHPPGADSSQVFDLGNGRAIAGAGSELIRGDGFVKLILNTRIK